MARITLETLINAPVERVFDLSLSIDLHKQSMAKTNEEAIAGRTSGIIQEGETVTWRAKHLGVTQKLTVKITKVEKPNYFKDEMVKGAFKSMAHEHIFEAKGDRTLMIDVFEFEAPFGPIGRLFNALFLENYMRTLLTERNDAIKRVAESGECKKLSKTNQKYLYIWPTPIEIDWTNLKDKIYDYDGSWRDLYVLNTNVTDWEKWANYVNESYVISWHNKKKDINESLIDFSVIKEYWNGNGDLMSSANVFIENIQINAHFFGDSEIENDIDPREFNSIEDHNKLIKYMVELSTLLDKEVILTPEGIPKVVLISVNRDIVYINM